MLSSSPLVGIRRFTRSWGTERRRRRGELAWRSELRTTLSSASTASYAWILALVVMDRRQWIDAARRRGREWSRERDQQRQCPHRHRHQHQRRSSLILPLTQHHQ